MAKDQQRSVQQVVFQFMLRSERIDRRSVNRVADDRVSYQIAMNSQLVCAPGERLQFDERVRLEPAFDAIKSLRRFAAFALRQYAPMRPYFRIAADGRVDLARIFFHAPAEERQVELLHPALAEMFRERAVRARRLGDDHHSRSVAVEAVNQA